jgi:hypothetical protein
LAFSRWAHDPADHTQDDDDQKLVSPSAAVCDQQHSSMIMGQRISTIAAVSSSFQSAAAATATVNMSASVDIDNHAFEGIM